jgi:hypothetical protein
VRFILSLGALGPPIGVSVTSAPRSEPPPGALAALLAILSPRNIMTLLLAGALSLFFDERFNLLEVWL